MMIDWITYYSYYWGDYLFQNTFIRFANWLILSRSRHGHENEDGTRSLWNMHSLSHPRTGIIIGTKSNSNTKASMMERDITTTTSTTTTNNNNEPPVASSTSAWNMNMPVANLMKPPEIDPYESWWNGKVSLFGFMRYLLRDYLFGDDDHGDNDNAVLDLTGSNGINDHDGDGSISELSSTSSVGVDANYGEHSSMSLLSSSAKNNGELLNHPPLSSSVQRQRSVAAETVSATATATKSGFSSSSATANDNFDNASSSSSSSSSFDDWMKQNTLFEFRLMRINPYRHHQQPSFKIVEGDVGNTGGGSSRYCGSSYTVITSTNSPHFVLFALVFILHYSYLLLQSRRLHESTVGDGNNDGSATDSSSLADQRGRCAPSHIYLRAGRYEDDDDDDLTCSEGGDDFEFEPPIKYNRTSSRAPPMIPPLLQHESVTSTDADTGDINAVLENQITTGVDGLPSYLISPRQSIRPRESMMRALEESPNDLPQSLPVEQSPFFLDDSATFVQSEDVKHFICFVTQVTEDENDLYELDAAHIAWRKKMTENGTIVASGAYAVSGTDGNSSKDGMMIIRATSYEAAQDIAMGDPYHQHCICTFRIMPWVVDNSAASKISVSEQCLIADAKLISSKGGDDKGDAVIG